MRDVIKSIGLITRICIKYIYLFTDYMHILYTFIAPLKLNYKIINFKNIKRNFNLKNFTSFFENIPMF